MTTQEALSKEILRAVNLIDGTGNFASVLGSANDAPVAFEDVGTRGFPHISFEISSIYVDDGATGCYRMMYVTDFYLYTKGSGSTTPAQSIANLIGDLESTLVGEWKRGNTLTNIKADSGADFIQWDYSGVEAQAYSPKQRGDAIANAVSFSAVIHRRYDSR